MRRLCPASFVTWPMGGRLVLHPCVLRLRGHAGKPHRCACGTEWTEDKP